jgi:hypothetical protein
MQEDVLRDYSVAFVTKVVGIQKDFLLSTQIIENLCKTNVLELTTVKALKGDANLGVAFSKIVLMSCRNLGFLP